MLRLPSSRAVLLFAAVVLLAVPPWVSAQRDNAANERRILSQVQPIYPEIARQMQMTGTVRLEVVVAPNGKLKTARVLGGSPLLAQAAVNAVEKWRWEPLTTETKVTVEFHFHP
jgi:protein TonB